MIDINDNTYVFLLISFLAGYFEYVYILLLIIFVHEYGHYCFSLIAGLKIKKIIIFPLGGITILNERLNISIIKEFFSLIGGIIFQLLFFYFIYKLHYLGLVTNHVYNIFYRINYILISFNFMPILPLDGGRLLNLLLDIFLPYKISYKVSIIVSFAFLIFFVLRFKTIVSFIISIILGINIYNEYNNIELKYRLFLYERFNYNDNFKKTKFINNINYFYRGHYHFINNIDEQEKLNNIFNI